MRTQVMHFVVNILKEAGIEVNLITYCALDLNWLLLGRLIIFLLFTFFGSWRIGLLLLLIFGDLTIDRCLWIILQFDEIRL